MTDLPKYTRVPDESQEIEPLTKGARDSFDSQLETSRPRATYPPNAEASSSGSEQHVTYIYEPKWSNDHQHVLGILGRDRRETLAIAREAFDDIEKYSDDRVEFYAKFEDREIPVRVMDAVWSRLVNRPPPFITVKIKDGPEDIEAMRQARKKSNQQECAAFAIFVTFLLAFVLVFVVAAILDNRNKHDKHE